MSAPKWNLDNLICVTDYNNIQIEGHVDEIMPIADLEQKYEAFGWAATVIDGHDMSAITQALKWADTHQKPAMIIAKTVS